MEVIEDVSQAKILKIDRGRQIDSAKSYIATVEKIYSDRNTCDILTTSGSLQRNIPIKTKGGMVDDEVYGEIDLPEVGDTVFVQFLSGKESLAYIDSTIIPFLNSKFAGNAVSSGSKQFTKKLLEANKPKSYRKIFKSGTTLEISEDGTVIIETPGGAFFLMDESVGEINITDSNGNIFKMETGKVTINGNLEVLQ